MKTIFTSLILFLVSAIESWSSILLTDLNDIVINQRIGVFQTLVDIDGNGSNEIDFRSLGSEFNMTSEPNFRYVATSEMEDRFVEPLESGSLIDESINSSNEREFLSGFSILSGIAAAAGGETIVFGNFQGEGYMGFELTLNDGIHFGWFRITSLGSSGGILHEYAYESRPGVGIKVGAVPEPSTTLLLLGASFLSLSRCRRRCFCYDISIKN